MSITRRQLLKVGAASGALLLADPARSLAGVLGAKPDAAASRASKLGSGLRLVHADLHNHSLLSDGDGDARNAFASMRMNGLDVAALTDHSGVGKLQGDTCQGCEQAVGIDEGEWRAIGELADAANEDGAFVAVRGFEWSSPTLGHMNVWFSSTWTDPLASGAVGAGTTAASLMHEGSDDLDEATQARVNELLRVIPEGQVSMKGFYDWLSAASSPVLGGGSDGIVGFNHPGREGGRFGFFGFDQRIVDRVVSIEMFNRGEDYLFEGVPETVSPLVECLDAGWRVGILGVTDEHGVNWGEPRDKGRTGVWIPAGAFTRDGVVAGMRSRRFFATRERGLRVDATANGVPMGGTLAGFTAGPITFVLDIDKGTEWAKMPVRIQVLQTGSPLPTVLREHDVEIPKARQKPVELTVLVDRDDGDWVVLRITDPAREADDRAPAGSAYAASGRAIAYASPFYLGTPSP